jgi:hypothetical protein
MENALGVNWPQSDKRGGCYQKQKSSHHGLMLT